MQCRSLSHTVICQPVCIGDTFIIDTASTRYRMQVAYERASRYMVIH